MAETAKRLLFACALAALASVSAFSSTILPGDILISNHNGDNIQLLDPATSAVSTLLTLSGSANGLAFDSSGLLYINLANGIERYNPNTNALDTSFFTGIGQREGLTFDPVTQHLFSVSFGGNDIDEVDLNGNLIRKITIPGSSGLLGVSARNGLLAITDLVTGNVYVGPTTGTAFPLVGNVDPGNTYAPAFDAAGNLFVNDFAAGQTVELKNLGGGLYGPATTFISGLSFPVNGLAIGDDGSFTISELGADAVSVWNSNGTLRQRYFGLMSPDELAVFEPVAGVPEPSTIFLLGIGLLCLVTQGYRKHQPHC